MIFHWFNVEVWQNMWPNVFAPSFFTLVAVIYSHIKTKKHLKRHSDKVEDLLNPNTPGGISEVKAENVTKSEQSSV